MDIVAALAPGERAELFRDAVETHPDVHLASLIEKDFWVCWTLHRLFGIESSVPLVFKGGTSLSKAYGVIRRFSEDIDLSLNREALGFSGDLDPSRAPSNKQAAARVIELDREVSAYLRSQLIPELRIDFEKIIGPQGGSTGWAMNEGDETGQAWSFIYPASPVSEAEDYYVRPHVLLEFGARSDHEPREGREIRPYAAESLPGEFEAPVCTPDTLLVDRTYWEKVTLLHMIANGGTAKLRERMARHYYDVFMLARCEYGDRALARLDLLDEVARHKQVFYRSSWARYEDARPGSLRIVPDDTLGAKLESDYRTMRQLFFEEPPDFSDIVEAMRAIEEAVNQPA